MMVLVRSAYGASNFATRQIACFTAASVNDALFFERYQITHPRARDLRFIAFWLGFAPPVHHESPVLTCHNLSKAQHIRASHNLLILHFHKRELGYCDICIYVGAKLVCKLVDFILFGNNKI